MDPREVFLSRPNASLRLLRPSELDDAMLGAVEIGGGGGSALIIPNVAHSYAFLVDV